MHFRGFNCLFCRRGYLSVVAAAIYMASQASEFKKSQKGKKMNSGGDTKFGKVWRWFRNMI